MNKTTTFLSLAALALVVGAVMTTTLTSASETDTSATWVQSSPRAEGNWFGRGRWNHHEKFQAVRAAVEANDFAAFQTAVTGTPLAEQIATEEQFAKFVQMHTLREAGKTDEAQAIATELGLPEMKGPGGRGPMLNEAVKTAIAANDYSAFQTAIADDATWPLASIDTAEEFAKLVKMHSLLEEAKALGEELGLPGPHEGRWGMGKWFGKMMK